MNDQYKELLKQVKDIESKFRSYVDQPEHGTAIRLDKSIDRLVQDTIAKKNPRSLEDQINRLVRQLKDAGSESDEMMDFRHLRDLESRLEEARDDIRKFSNY